MGERIELGHGAWIDESEIELLASRSGGPGGQHANVTASRIEARIDVPASTLAERGPEVRDLRPARPPGERRLPGLAQPGAQP